MLKEQKELFTRNHKAQGDALEYIVQERVKQIAPKYDGDEGAARSAVIRDIAARVGLSDEQVESYLIPF